MNSNSVVRDCDVLVIGSGAAGLSLAISLASNNIKVIVISKAQMNAGSTNYAQGGIAGVFNTADDNDSVAEHVEDTLIAGAGMCDKSAVEFTLKNAHDSIEWLIEQGVPFDTREDERKAEQSPYHLHREGGHSHRRIFHAADHTGHTIQDTLNKVVMQTPNIEVLTDTHAIDLITTRKLGLAGNRVLGAYVYNTKNDTVETVKAKFTALCTGGASKVYQYTCNPEVSSGDWSAMAWRAGCRVANI